MRFWPDMRFENLRVLTLSAFSHGESNRIVDFFSREKGRLSAVAHGARKQLSRFALVSEPATLASVVLVPGKSSDLFTLREAEVEVSFQNIKKSYTDLESVFSFLQVLGNVTLRNQPEEKLFDYAVEILELFDSGTFSREHFSLGYKLLALYFSGQMPDWKACSRCSRRDLPLRLSREGILCQSCAASRGEALDENTAAFLAAASAEIQRLPEFDPQPELCRISNAVLDRLLAAALSIS